jgi:proline-specific peptidase
MELYLDELATVRQTLGLERLHILGHSWGGMLALEYALGQPDGLAGLILSDTAASLPQWVAEVQQLVAKLPVETQQVLKAHQEAGTTDSPEYREAYKVFSRRHILPLDPKPEYWTRAADKPGNTVYRTMWGASEVHVTGTLKDWDVIRRLGEIHVPTLVLCGRHDEATPVLAETIQHGIKDAEMVIFENSAHAPHVQETERYLQVLDQFLDRVEKTT